MEDMTEHINGYRKHVSRRSRLIQTQIFKVVVPVLTPVSDKGQLIFTLIFSSCFETAFILISKILNGWQFKESLSWLKKEKLLSPLPA